jgi:hypothetical protein
MRVSLRSTGIERRRFIDGTKRQTTVEHVTPDAARAEAETKMQLG